MKRLFIGAGLVIGAIVVIGAVVVGANLLRRAPDVSPSLQRPPAGQARADYLADGTPVWVIGHEDGSVDVLSGFDTHEPLGLGKLLWWCPSARALDNPHHGSKWDEYGVKLGGPAPAGLASLEVSVSGSRVFLGEPRPAPSIGTPPHGPDVVNREWCFGPQDGVVFHTFDDWEVWESPTAAVEAAPEGWILLEGELVPAPGEDRIHLCSLGGCADSAVVANVEVPPPDLLELGSPIAGTSFIARVRDGVLVEVTRTVFSEATAP